MTTPEALIAFTLAAGLLTLTPGLDTALVIRTAAAEGPRRATGAAIGIGLGCFIWGAAAAFGVGALLTASEMAYAVLKWVGAAYLTWTGIRMILKPRDQFEPGEMKAIDAKLATNPGLSADNAAKVKQLRADGEAQRDADVRRAEPAAPAPQRQQGQRPGRPEEPRQVAQDAAPGARAGPGARRPAGRTAGA